MKNLTLLFAIVLTTAMFTSSCKKEEGKQNNLNVTVSINENSTYTFTLPPGLQGGNFTISQQASNYITSAVNPVSGTSAVNYTYTPALNYVGSEKVVLSASDAHHGGGCQHNQNGNCNHQGGHCDHHDSDDNSTITINIAVVASTTK
jgi:hypothetical protein